jgi:hypothetical protein
MTEETQFTDEYFINLTMDYDKRDDSIYPKWAVWCAKSDDRYYIDGKDGHFYTHARTDEEIAIERKKREILEASHSQEMAVDEEGRPTEEWIKYECYLHDLVMDEEHILEVTPKTFEEWKQTQPAPAEEPVEEKVEE